MRVIFVLFGLTCLLALAASAQPNTLPRTDNMRLGVGAMIGTPTAIDAKYWIDNVQALEGAIGWSRGGYPPNRDVVPSNDVRTLIQANYMLHNSDLLGLGTQFPLGYGVGARYAAGGSVDASVSAMAVGSLSYIPAGAPIDVFIQVAPLLQLSPSTDFAFEAGVGARYYIF